MSDGVETTGSEATGAGADTATATTGAETTPAATGADSVSGSTGADSVSGSSDTGLVRPEGLPDEFWDAASGVKTGDLWTAYQEMKAAGEAAKADLPDTPEGYELKVSDAVQVPEGFKVEVDAKDPFFA